MPNKHNTLNQYCVDVRLSSTTLAQHQPNIGSMSRVIWVVDSSFGAGSAASGHYVCPVDSRRSVFVPLCIPALQCVSTTVIDSPLPLQHLPIIHICPLTVPLEALSTVTWISKIGIFSQTFSIIYEPEGRLDRLDC